VPVHDDPTPLPDLAGSAPDRMAAPAIGVSVAHGQREAACPHTRPHAAPAPQEVNGAPGCDAPSAPEGSVEDQRRRARRQPIRIHALARMSRCPLSSP
jgi:hypothetical protein